MVARVRGTSGLRSSARFKRGLGRAGNWANQPRHHLTHAHTIPMIQTGPTRHTVYIRLYTLQLYIRVMYNWEILDRHSLLGQ